MAEESPDSISFTLIENAIDFIRSAVAYVKVKEEHPRCFKYGLLHLCDGIELLLKCRLNNEHWTLVVADIDKTSASDVQSGDFKSVGWDEAITRVEKCRGHDFGAKEKSLLKHLRKLRNRIQHFDVQLKRAETEAILAEGLHFATRFVEVELADEGLQDDLSEMHVDLKEFQAFVTARMQEIAPQLDGGYALPCPRCRQEALLSDADRSKCAFCGYDEDAETAASEWVDEFGGIRSLKDEWAEPSVEQCPECASDAFVHVSQYLDDDDAPQYHCFGCGTEGEFERCVICNGFFQPQDQETACLGCLRAQIEKDKD